MLTNPNIYYVLERFLLQTTIYYVLLKMMVSDILTDLLLRPWLRGPMVLFLSGIKHIKSSIIYPIHVIFRVNLSKSTAWFKIHVTEITSTVINFGALWAFGSYDLPSLFDFNLCSFSSCLYALRIDNYLIFIEFNDRKLIFIEIKRRKICK